MNKHLHIAIKESSDLQLLKIYKQTKDMHALGVLYERYIHLVYGVALKYLKEKVLAQDAVIQIFEELVEKVLKHEIVNFKSWLHVLTRNHCLMYLRSKQYKNARNAVDIDALNMENEGLMHHQGDEQKLELQINKLEHCIERLKSDQKACIELFYLQQKSYKEIEQHMNLPIKKVKSHIQNGKRNLKLCIEGSE